MQALSSSHSFQSFFPVILLDEVEGLHACGAASRESLSTQRRRGGEHWGKKLLRGGEATDPLLRCLNSEGTDREQLVPLPSCWRRSRSFMQETPPPPLSSSPTLSLSSPSALPGSRRHPSERAWGSRSTWRSQSSEAPQPLLPHAPPPHPPPFPLFTFCAASVQNASLIESTGKP